MEKSKIENLKKYANASMLVMKVASLASSSNDLIEIHFLHKLLNSELNKLDPNEMICEYLLEQINIELTTKQKQAENKAIVSGKMEEYITDLNNNLHKLPTQNSSKNLDE